MPVFLTAFPEERRHGRRRDSLKSRSTDRAKAHFLRRTTLAAVEFGKPFATTRGRPAERQSEVGFLLQAKARSGEDGIEERLSKECEADLRRGNAWPQPGHQE